MATADKGFHEWLGSLGSLDELRQASEQGEAPAARPLANAHIHLPPNFSAFDTTAQAVRLASEQEVLVLGASNYYDYSVYREFGAEAVSRGIFPLFGLEIICLVDSLVREDVRVNDPGNPGKYYLCGKGISRFEPMSAGAASLLQTIRDNDSARMEAMTGRLNDVFSAGGVRTRLSATHIKGYVAARHECSVNAVYLQERHLAQAFQERVFALVPAPERMDVLGRVYGCTPKAGAEDDAGVQADIRALLMKAGKAAFIADTFVGFDHAYRLVLALGGIPCYPVLADGARPITGYEADVQALASDLTARGIPCAELIPVRNSPEALERYVMGLREAGLFVTSGTEHNTQEMLPLAPACAGGVPIPAHLQDVFWEGTCVVVAHQYLTAHGKPGFVDASGTLNESHATADARIKAFAALGSAIIARYQARVGLTLAEHQQ